MHLTSVVMLQLALRRFKVNTQPLGPNRRRMDCFFQRVRIADPGKRLMAGEPGSFKASNTGR